MKGRKMRKGMLVALAGIVGVIGWAPAAMATCADLNNDGVISIADAVRLIQVVGSHTTSASDCGGAGTLACGDLNADGALSVSDVVIILAKLTNNPTLFPLCSGPGPVLACPGGGAPAVVSGHLTQTKRWTTACPVYVDGLTFVDSGVTITMDPGMTVVGKNPPSSGTGGPTNVSALIFLRGSKINAQGDKDHPIVMTSQDHFEHNNGNIGDWGGLSVCGNAPVNCPGGECFAEGLVGVPFGGSNPNDSSGVMEFVRVEFSGKELSPDNELNIITYNGVGRGTILDHVDANVGFDDCQEWFGGTVDAKFMVATGCGDEMHDTQLGTTGRFQYYLGAYYNPYMQNLGNEMFEWDDNENGFDLLPRNAPKVCNATMIGSRLQTNTIGENTEFGTNLRRGTSGIIANTIIEHVRDAGIKVTDNATAAQACDNATTLHPGGLLVEHTLLFDNGGDNPANPGDPARQIIGNWTTPCTAAQWYSLLPSVSPSDPTQLGTDPQIPVTYGLGLGTSQTDLNQFIPAGSSPGVASEPLVNSLAMDCKTIDPFFDTTNYVGALKPGDPASNWLAGSWVSLALH